MSTTRRVAGVSHVRLLPRRVVAVADVAAVVVEVAVAVVEAAVADAAEVVAEAGDAVAPPRPGAKVVRQAGRANQTVIAQVEPGTPVVQVRELRRQPASLADYLTPSHQLCLELLLIPLD